MEAYHKRNDVAVHSTTKWTKLLLYVLPHYYVHCVFLMDNRADYYGDTFFQSAGTT